ncbi:MAG: hypothetical protein QG641_2284 [Candidatus Poribacteria bacterium]|nr:hypothetical protein [Candidatus Poribacteria bacterium]
MNSVFQKLKQKIDDLKVELLAVWFAYRDPRTPWYAKVWSALVAGYAFSPIDLIPDFIPIIGYLDDALIVPLGIMIAIKLIPKEVMTDTRIKAKDWIEQRKQKPQNKTMAVLIVLLWILLFLLIVRYVLKAFILSKYL